MAERTGTVSTHSGPAYGSSYEFTYDGVCDTDDIVSFVVDTTEVLKYVRISYLRAKVTDDNGGAITEVNPEFHSDVTPVADTVQDSTLVSRCSWGGATPTLVYAFCGPPESAKIPIYDGKLYLRPKPNANGGEVSVMLTLDAKI